MIYVMDFEPRLICRFKKAEAKAVSKPSFQTCVPADYISLLRRGRYDEKVR